MQSKLSTKFIKSFGVGLAAILTAFSPITINAAQSSGKTLVVSLICFKHLLVPARRKFPEWIL